MTNKTAGMILLFLTFVLLVTCVLLWTTSDNTLAQIASSFSTVGTAMMAFNYLRPEKVSKNY